MKKNIVAVVVIVAFVGYLVYERNAAAPTPLPSMTTTGNNTTTSGNSATLYKDGEYIGPVTDAFYGPLQVKAVISGGKIVDVVALKYPDDRAESINVSAMSLPVLKSEAIAIQSAKVNIVSGATQTAEAYQKSLAAALAEAKI
jgi:uncharacterized protein with FMN-binding domain